jgi:hypothetical protein
MANAPRLACVRRRLLERPIEEVASSSPDLLPMGWYSEYVLLRWITPQRDSMDLLSGRGSLPCSIQSRGLYGWTSMHGT